MMRRRLLISGTLLVVMMPVVGYVLFHSQPLISMVLHRTELLDRVLVEYGFPIIIRDAPRVFRSYGEPWYYVSNVYPLDCFGVRFRAHASAEQVVHSCILRIKQKIGVKAELQGELGRDRGATYATIVNAEQDVTEVGFFEIDIVVSDDGTPGDRRREQIDLRWCAD